MNSERFCSALDGISDGLIDAAAGAYEKKANKKWILRCAACAACALLVLTAIGLFWNAPAGAPDPTQPTISMENPTTAPTQPAETTVPTDQIGGKNEGTRVFYLSTMGGTETPLKSDIATPIEYIVYYRDLRGLSDEEYEEATAQWHAFETELLSGAGEYSHTSYAANDLIICTYIKGFLGITSSRGNISDLYVSTNTRVGNYSWGMVGDAYYVEWYLNHEVLIEDPDMSLSSIRDSLEVTITYEDSTTECIVIDITIDDEGQVYATLAEAPTAA